MSSSSKECTYENIGTVLYNTSKRAKRIIIRIKQNGTVQVSVPPFAGFKKAEKFVLSKEDWILNTLQKIKKNIKAEKVFTENTPNVTPYHDLVFKTSTDYKIKAFVSKTSITIQHPVTLSRTGVEIQELVKKAISQALTQEAKMHIAPRVHEFASKFRLSFNRLTFRNNKSRWGSCSSNNNINLNIQLMYLPSHLIDYVILHELAHIPHKNHGPGFRKCLDEMLNNDSRKYDKELRQYSAIL